jgi:hypothetical protein
MRLRLQPLNDGNRISDTDARAPTSSAIEESGTPAAQDRLNRRDTATMIKLVFNALRRYLNAS